MDLWFVGGGILDLGPKLIMKEWRKWHKLWNQTHVMHQFKQTLEAEDLIENFEDIASEEILNFWVFKK